MGTVSGSVQSVDRIFDLVETIAMYPQGIALSDLAKQTNLHISTVHRLTGMLVQRGYAAKDSVNGKYRLTLRMFEIGSQATGVHDLLSLAKPLLDDLAMYSREAVHLVMRDQWDVVYLYKAEPFRQSVQMSSCVGRHNPMYCTGVGKSILASLPAEEAKEIWDHTELIRYTDHTITEWDEMEREMERIRARGYAIDEQEHELEVRCIAKAVLDWKGTPVAAVSISAPSYRMGEEEIATLCPRLLKTAENISNMLGNINLIPE